MIVSALCLQASKGSLAKKLLVYALPGALQALSVHHRYLAMPCDHTQVHLLVDAISSQREHDRAVALQRMAGSGERYVAEADQLRFETRWFSLVEVAVGCALDANEHL